EPTLFLDPGGAKPAAGTRFAISSAAPALPPARGFWAFRSAQVAPGDQQTAPSVSAAADRFFSAAERAGNEAAARGGLQGRLRKGTDAALQAVEQSEKIARRLAEVREWEERVGAASLEALPALREALATNSLLPARAAPGAAEGKKGSERAVSEFPSGVRIRK